MPLHRSAQRMSAEGASAGQHRPYSRAARSPSQYCCGDCQLVCMPVTCSSGPASQLTRPLLHARATRRERCFHVQVPSQAYTRWHHRKAGA